MKAAALAFAILCATPAWAEPTDIIVRVQSQGAKFVGSSMGGAQVILRDADTGEVLAQGLTVGATGDTKRIMGAAHGAPVADEKTAAFRARIDIGLPRLIEVEATGPMAQRQSMARVSAQYWLIPGQPVIGDGWTLILPGLVVDAVEPAAHQRLGKAQKTLRIAVNVAMMCGCPIEDGGPWDAAHFDVRALITGPDRHHAPAPALWRSHRLFRSGMAGPGIRRISPVGLGARQDQWRGGGRPQQLHSALTCVTLMVHRPCS